MEYNELTDKEWADLSSRCAKSALARAHKVERRENFIKTINQGAAFVAAFLLIQFPLSCLAFESIERAALNACAQELAVSLDADEFGGNNGAL